MRLVKLTSETESIDFSHPTRLVYGLKAIDRLGSLAAELGCSRVLVVSDEGVVAAGHFQRGVDALGAAGLQVTSFHDVQENPSAAEVEAGAAAARDFQPDLLIGLGGGSSVDCARGINFLYSCGGQMEDYWGVGKATGPMLPMIAVPTTAGTGSEAQSFALISQVGTHIKMACGDKRAACRVAVLDPELTLTMPTAVTGLSGIDAISHAVETYVTKPRNPLSVCYSRRAWQLLSSSFPLVVENPESIQARADMQMGAYFAGLAIETSMLGAAHALANPLTARFGISHGQAVGMMLPQVVRFNGEQVGAWYGDLWRDVAHTPLGQQCRRVNESESLAEFVHHLVRMAGLETELNRVGVSQDSLDQLATDATSQWTGNFNPRQLTQNDFRELYDRTFRKREAG